MHHSEDGLVRKAARGDRDALGLLWDTITPKLFGYLMNTLRDRALAEDIVQTTWLRAIEGLPRFQDKGKGLGPWLFAIARNECRQYWRTQPREVPLDLHLHDTSENAEPTYEKKLIIEQALEGLPEDDRELLRLRYIADLKTADVARVLHINFVTVRVRLHRALTRARIALQSQKP